MPRGDKKQAMRWMTIHPHTREEKQFMTKEQRNEYVSKHPCCTIARITPDGVWQFGR